MQAIPNDDRFTRFALACGIAVPLLYFGAQLAAAPFFPGYSFLAHSASLLGSDLSDRPSVLNAGAMATGAAALVAAAGFWRALRGLGTPFLLSGLVSLAVASSGGGALWAGLFPLPDPRHDPGALGAGLFLLPVLFLPALWHRVPSRALRAYLVANAALFVALFPLLSGATGLDTSGYAGLLQRLFAVSAFGPIGVIAAVLLRTGTAATAPADPRFAARAT